jgi:hypothetical protein
MKGKLTTGPLRIFSGYLHNPLYFPLWYGIPELKGSPMLGRQPFIA